MKGGDPVLNVEYEDDGVKELFDDLNDVRNSKNLMKKEIGAELTKTVKKRYNQIVAFTSFSALQQSGIKWNPWRETERGHIH